MAKKKYRALIIGAGRIGAFFDSPKDEKILTHAHGYHKYPGFDIAGFVDANLGEAVRAAKMWGGVAYSSIKEAFAKNKTDVVSVCVPDDLHFSILQELKKYPILGGIVEKPLTTSLSDSKKIIQGEFYKERPFLINYMRRYVPEFQQIREKIRSGKYGKLLSGNINHGKGLLHNGSHLIDLLIYFGLNIKKAHTISKINDFYPEDWSYSAILEMPGGGKINLNIIPASYYRVFEMDLIFEKGRIKIIKDGFQIEEYLVNDDQIFKGYKVLKLNKTYNTELGSALSYTIDNLYKSIMGKEEPFCSLADGYVVQKVCEEIMDSKPLF